MTIRCLSQALSAIPFATLLALSLITAVSASPGVAEGQDARRLPFHMQSERFGLGCQYDPAKRRVSIARKDERGRIRSVSDREANRTIRRLTQQAVNTRSNSRRQRSRAELVAYRSIIRQCRTIGSAGCGNRRQDPFELGTDCGGVCRASCQAQETGPTPDPTSPPSGIPAPPEATPTATPSQPSLLNTECTDGIDNDDDGLVDFGLGDFSMADFGCLGPNAQETSNDYGYTLFEPSSDTRIIYVSSSTGSDSNSGLDPNSPKQTILAGYELLRNDSADWLLLKRGDTFDGTNDFRQRLSKSLTADPFGPARFLRSGRSPGERMLIASYGPSDARPVIKTGTESGFVIWNERNLALVGIDFHANSCDPNAQEFFDVSCPNGINIMYSNRDILIEDNRVRYFGGGINVQSPGDGGGVLQWDRVTVRRNIIENQYSGTGHSQGMFSSGAGRLLIQQNIMYHNGWNADYRMNLRPAPFDQLAWNAISAGRVNVTLDGQVYRLSGMNFSTATSYEDVAEIIEAELRAAVPSTVSVDLSYTGKWIILRSNLPSTTAYSVSAYTGSAAGTDLHTAGLLNVSSSNPRTPAATIFNRNYYGSAGYSNTIVEGNITAVGASGGLQVRMGGVIRGNVTLDEPVGISVGHAENPVGVPITATIENNVVLGSSNISGLPRGFGLGFAGQGFTVRGNIIAHNVRGTGNVEGLFSDTDSSTALQQYQDGLVENNVVYNWSAPNGNGTALALRHFVFFNVIARNNFLVQPRRGSLVHYSSDVTPSGFVLDGNTFFAPQGGTLFSIAGTPLSAAQFSSQTGSPLSFINPGFPDPERDIISYNALLGGDISLEDFMRQALQQRRMYFRQEYTADAVASYIRDGFFGSE